MAYLWYDRRVKVWYTRSMYSFSGYLETPSISGVDTPRAIPTGYSILQVPWAAELSSARHPALTSLHDWPLRSDNGNVIDWSDLCRTCAEPLLNKTHAPTQVTYV